MLLADLARRTRYSPVPQYFSTASSRSAAFSTFLACRRASCLASRSSIFADGFSQQAGWDRSADHQRDLSGSNSLDGPGRVRDFCRVSCRILLVASFGFEAVWAAGRDRAAELLAMMYM